MATDSEENSWHTVRGSLAALAITGGAIVAFVLIGRAVVLLVDAML